jgi:PAT family beta-lactamase induction signal transducer AmpG
METNKSRNFLFIMFGALYFVQGVIQAYQLNFFKPHLDAEGISADRIATLAGLALVPFMLKWIFGIISDRVNLFGKGHRVPYMVLGVILCAIAFGSAYFISPADQYSIMAAIILIGVSAMALFDATADALAVDIVDDADHGKVQSVMTGGRAAGFIIISAIFGYIAARFGYSAIFLAMGVIILFPLAMVFQVKEPSTRTTKEKFNWGAFKALGKPNYLLFIAFQILAWTTFQGTDGLVTFYMSKELQIGPELIGRYGMLKGLGLVIGALIVGWMMNRFGIKTAALTTLSLVSVGGLVFSRITGVNTILTVSVAWGIVVAFHWTVYAAYSMGITDKRIAGSMFAILMTVGNIGLGLGELATSFVDEIGFSGVFSTIALINLALIPLLFITMRKFDKEKTTLAQGT